MEESFTDNLIASMMAMNPDTNSRCRGILDDDGNVLSRASEVYLHVLSIEILRAWSQNIMANINTITDDDEAENRLAYVCFEIRRLLRHPELFPTNEARARFLATFALDSELQFHTVCTNLLIKVELDAVQSDTENDYTRPTYVDGLHGWENFLLNMAPGGPSDPTDRAYTLPRTSFQLIPPVGMRIISDFEREERAIQRYVEGRPEQQRFNVTAATTMLVDFEKQSNESMAVSGIVLPQQTQNATTRPNPFRQVSGSIPEHTTSSLLIEDIGTFVHKLEHPPPPPNQPVPSLHDPNVFPQVSIRSWHPPARSQEIRYDHSAR